MSEYTIDVGGMRIQSDGPLGELELELTGEGGVWRVYDNQTGVVVASSRAAAWNEGSTEA